MYDARRGGLMLRWLVLLVLMVIAGCDDGAAFEPPKGDGGTQDDAATDAAADAVVDAAPDVEEPDCLCEGVSECCDGCQPRNVGEACDDGRECTLASSCDELGVCRGESDACDYLLTDPQCQAVACDDVLGCGAVGSIRQGLPCDDGDDRTYDDRCNAGACVGTPCECDAENECCDGCLAINEGGECNDGNPATHFDACSGGSCAGRPCECSSGPCCDGCWFRGPETVCKADADGWDRCLTEEGVFPGELEYAWADRVCSGTSSACDGPLAWKETVHFVCTPDRYCRPESPGCYKP